MPIQKPTTSGGVPVAAVSIGSVTAGATLTVPTNYDIVDVIVTEALLVTMPDGYDGQTIMLRFTKLSGPNANVTFKTNYNLSFNEYYNIGQSGIAFGSMGVSLNTMTVVELKFIKTRWFMSSSSILYFPVVDTGGTLATYAIPNMTHEVESSPRVMTFQISEYGYAIGWAPINIRIDWGDGTAVDTTTAVFDTDGGSITGTHTYDNAGTYTVAVSIENAQGTRNSHTSGNLLTVV